MQNLCTHFDDYRKNCFSAKATNQSSIKQLPAFNMYRVGQFKWGQLKFLLVTTE